MLKTLFSVRLELELYVIYIKIEQVFLMFSVFIQILKFFYNFEVTVACLSSEPTDLGSSKLTILL
jgi:hypothetical protein